MLPVIAVLLFLLHSLQARSQQINNVANDIDTTDKKDLIDVYQKFFKVKPTKMAKRGKKKVYFSLLPTSSSVPGGGRALITSTRAGFYLGERRNTFLSSVSFSPYLNFKGRYSIAFRSDIYTSKNRYNIQGDTRFSRYPEYVYGTSTNRRGERLLITYNYIRLYQTVLKRLKPYFLAGIGYNLDYHMGINSVNDTIGFAKFTGYEHGTGVDQNTVSSGITFNLLYDSRNNSINPLPGGYVNLIYRLNPSFLGNRRSSWKSIYLDTRKYIDLKGRKRHVLALWNYIWTALDNDVPYLDLPGIGYEPYQRSGRGIEMNRYRGKSLVYFEGEYRSDITANGLLGFVVFANVNTVTGPANGRFSAPHPAAGAGLRIKFNKRANTNIAVDFGVSKGRSAVTLNLGEVF
ncbi:MAG: hypothetical protein JWQ40_1509 [Segetibacter sp.]|nr:hypothetical protein [Segetibacter sp.]